MDGSSRSIIHVMDKKLVVLLDPRNEEESKNDVLRMNRSREKRYAFDRVFDMSEAQETVFLESTKFLVEGLLDG